MEKTPYVGQLDRKVKIVALVPTRNSTNEEETTDQMVANPWAKMEDVSGSEELDGKVRYLFSRKYIIRFSKVIKESSVDLVLIDGTDRFNIYHTKEIGRKKYIEILVESNE